MPRITVDQLVGYQFTVAQGAEPVIDNGTPVHDMKGEVKTLPVWVLTFGCPHTGHRVVATLNEQAKNELVAMLSGGVVPASPGDVAALVGQRG